MENIMVSIICTAYNHGAFIGECLKSLINQKTNFNYEILVNDDASSDNTAEIIREYQDRYPDVVIGFYQKENLYSRKISTTKHMTDVARGKYIAICEGDDFWVDTSKLQKQVDLLEQHPECTMCIGGANLINIDGTNIGDVRPFEKSGFYHLVDYFQKKANIPTASIMYNIKHVAIMSRKEYKIKSDVGDVPIALYMFSEGSVYYFDDIFSAYRVNNPNSWTGQNHGDRWKKHLSNKIYVYKLFNEDSKGKFETEVNCQIKKMEFELLLLNGDIKTIKKDYKDMYSNLNLKRKIGVYIRLMCPNFDEIRHQRRRKKMKKSNV